MEAKRLGLLHELVPKATTIAVLIDANNPASEIQLRDVQEAAPRLGVQLVVLRANVESDFAPVFATLVQQRAEALLVCSTLHGVSSLPWSGLAVCWSRSR